MVHLAIGFTGVRPSPLFEQLGVNLDSRTRIVVDEDLRAAPVVVAAGDAVIGASLVVNAIADGRRAAATCDRILQAAPRAAAV
jgi:glutamate synthase (NADPH/NADH) small chain